MASSSNRFDELGKDPSCSKEQETRTRLTDLPAEIRNEIYRYLLATDYATERKMNPELRAFGGLILGFDRERPQHKYAGTLRCQNVWLEHSCYSLNILRVSRQIYQEASPIFSSNSWIFVRVNRSFFAMHLKNRGFNAIRLNNTQGIKISILALLIHFPRQRFDSGSDSFVMSTSDAAKLQRALSTVTGLEEMKLTFIASSDFPKGSNPITKAFSDLRGVGIASVCGPGSRHSLGIMARTISSPLVSTSDDKDAIKELTQGRVQDSLSEAEAHQSNQEWHKTVAQCETSMAYIIDCHSIYYRLIRRDCVKWSFLQNTYQILFEMLVEATYWIGDYDAVISYSEHEYHGRYLILVGSVLDFRRRAFRKLEERGVASWAVLRNRLGEELAELEEARRPVVTSSEIMSSFLRKGSSSQYSLNREQQLIDWANAAEFSTESSSESSD